MELIGFKTLRVNKNKIIKNKNQQHSHGAIERQMS